MISQKYIYMFIGFFIGVVLSILVDMNVYSCFVRGWRAHDFYMSLWKGMK